MPEGGTKEYENISPDEILGFTTGSDFDKGSGLVPKRKILRMFVVATDSVRQSRIIRSGVPWKWPGRGLAPPGSRRDTGETVTAADCQGADADLDSDS
ncbi:MAG: hypothetical protein KDM91_13780, partial [Verrucomicrobiae bacterium]|nr:hypothetical protein [Verrucomicrobiae bacterium]